MNRPRSISDLNERWWYRFLKVSFIFGSALIVILGWLIIFGVVYGNGVNYQASIIMCENGLSTPLSNVDHSSSLDDLFAASLYTPYFSTILDKKLKSACSHFVKMRDGTTVLNLDAGKINYQKVVEIDGHSYNGNDSMIPFYPDQTYKNYSLEIVRDNQVINVLIYCLLWLVGILLVMESLRRIFYYIILGKFLPTKN